MGYFADIIRDSRLNPASRRSPVPPVPVMNGQALPAVTQEAVPGSPTRRLVGHKAPAAAAQIEPHTASAEIVSARRSNSRPSPRVKKSQYTRPSSAGVKYLGSGGPLEAIDAHVAIPVIQRQVLTDAEPRPAAETGPTVSGSRQSDGPSRGRLAISRPASKRRSASSRVQGAAADPLVQELSPHLALPAGERREEVNRPLAQPIESENSLIKTEAPPAAEPSAAPAGQPNRSNAADASTPARLKGTTTKPSLPVGSIRSAQSVENFSSASAGRIDLPRVQIGQVNVIVEESRVPPKAPPGDLRRDDSASRTFLRSL